MLDRALVKRLRDSDSDSEKEEEGSSSRSKESSTDKPTDILTTDKPTEAPVRVIFRTEEKKNATKSFKNPHEQEMVDFFSNCVFSQGTSAGGVKRAKVESWQRSVGTLGSGGAIGSLVVRKKAAANGNKPCPVATTTAPASQTGNTLYVQYDCLFEGFDCLKI